MVLIHRAESDMLPIMGLITTAKFAELAGVCTKTAYTCARTGIVKSVRIPGKKRDRYLIHESEVTSARFLNRPRPGFPRGRKKTRKSPAEKI